ncbi:alpha/beta fold hydrolase [Luteimonas sp. 3794]|uniref:alpha/beta fold hydrolase n=1 Tax=Luteimonas sp. 3794 TaxID=2817730 RepID=UPI0028612B01|nr:alpha/beta fold hydrolase [Luteimonas sp. 3794]MDR6991540.1 pimeloyl-ACP methyl ester carboxylesterase [Luteimonas sp. 3794]
MRAVLLPGMDGSGTLHGEFVAAMAPRFQVETVAYPPDRILSYAQLQAFVVDRLPGDAPFLLIGESFSGPIAIRIAAARPPSLIGLVLCASFAASPRPWLRHLQPLLGLPLPKPPTRMLMPAMMDRWTTRDWTRREQRALADLPAAVARARLSEVLKVDATAELARIRDPVLYLQASHDRLVPRRCWHEIHAHLPRATRVRLRGPHFLLQHQPALAARAVQRHFPAAV